MKVGPCCLDVGRTGRDVPYTAGICGGKGASWNACKHVGSCSWRGWYGGRGIDDENHLRLSLL